MSNWMLNRELVFMTHDRRCDWIWMTSTFARFFLLISKFPYVTAPLGVFIFPWPPSQTYFSDCATSQVILMYPCIHPFLNCSPQLFIQNIELQLLLFFKKEELWTTHLVNSNKLLLQCSAENTHSILQTLTGHGLSLQHINSMYNLVQEHSNTWRN